MQPALRSSRQDWDWYCDRLDRLANMVDAYDFLRGLTDEAGFRHFAALKMQHDGEGGLSRQLIFTTLPETVIRGYDAAENALGSALRTARPFTWQHLGKTTADPEQADDRGRAVLARAGIRMGLGIPVFSSGSARGLVAFGGDRPLPDIDEVGRLSLGAIGLFDRMMTLDKPIPSMSEPRLTMRERQCLTWIGAGKTSVEIAAILGLSEHTVNQYVTSGCQKLGAVNRAQAVAKAIRLRLID